MTKTFHFIAATALLMGMAVARAADGGEGAAPEAKSDKSIIDPKYRVKGKEADWLGKTISDATTAFKDVTVSKVVEGSDEKVTTTEKRADGIDVDALFDLAKANGLTDKTAKFETQRDTHGFPGRFRMTVRNMLQATVKQRHGLFVGEIWTPAPGEWLTAKGAPESPTHNQDGSKIAVAKAAEPAAAETAGE